MLKPFSLFLLFFCLSVVPIAEVRAASVEATLPIIPTINASMVTHLQGILQQGEAKGNRPDVFAKMGDSITESESFLTDFGDPHYDPASLGDHADLLATINYFRQTTLPDSYTQIWYQVANSFSVASPSAVSGWSVDQALDPAQLDPSYAPTCPAPSNTPLTCELARLHPGFALIMYGTNDLIRFNDPAIFQTQLQNLVQQTMDAGTIPILSTIPPRLDATDQSVAQGELDSRVATYNAAIAAVAQDKNVPLINFWRALQPLPHFGIDTDNVHPNVLHGGDHATLTAEGLQYGYNMRNLITLETLAEVKTEVIDGAAVVVPVVQPVTSSQTVSAPPHGAKPLPVVHPQTPLPFFTLGVLPNDIVLKPGAHATAHIVIYLQSKFRKTVRLTVSGASSAVRAQLRMRSMTQADLTITIAPHTASATITLTVQGKWQTTKRTVQVHVHVTPIKPPAPKLPLNPPLTSSDRAPSPTPPANGLAAMIAGCQMFPSDNPWNQDVSRLPVRADSGTFIHSIGFDTTLHPDFGQDPTYGIPFDVVPGTQPFVPITFTAYGSESDPGPYPIPPNAHVEAGSDHHVLVLDSGNCTLYELYHAVKNSNDAGWSADSGAIWNLRSNAFRPLEWTSADEAGLPILPGLVRYDEIVAGHIDHAIRFTVDGSLSKYIFPATHRGSSDNASLPPMGLRVRLKASYDISNLTGQALIIAQAMKKYGMIVADDGGPWYFQGATDSRWNDDQLNELKTIPGSAFDAVDTGIIH